MVRSRKIKNCLGDIKYFFLEILGGGESEKN